MAMPPNNSLSAPHCARSMMALHIQRQKTPDFVTSGPVAYLGEQWKTRLLIMTACVLTKSLEERDFLLQAFIYLSIKWEQ